MTVWVETNGSAVANCSDVTCDTSGVITYVSKGDEEPGILSDATYRVVEKALDCGGRPFFFFIGAPTNLLNMIIFFRQGLRDRMNLCLFSLAFVDLMYVTSKFIMASYCFVGEENFMLREVWKYTVRKNVVNFVFGFLYSSGCLTMIIAVERCVVVVLPMKAATIMKTRTMGLLIVFSILSMNALCSVYCFKYDVLVFDDVNTGKFTVMLTASAYYKRYKFVIDFVENIVLSTITFVSFFVVSIATCVTVIKLRNAMAWRQQSGTATSAERRQMTLVKMLVTLSCIFVICATPTICVALARLFVSGFWAQSRYRRMYYVTHIGATVILMMNSSVNFFVYVTQSSRFRAELRVLFLGKKAKS
ncbi:uncharacterized protein LOC143285154 [Babylonia areolata]|uniref:uncharacterized protein LOC143285154 n=1 Tax=Babylonia areolata TaxID=304850 RepID=UPI003FD2F013